MKFIETKDGGYINVEHIVRTHPYSVNSRLSTVELSDGSTDLVYAYNLKNIAHTFVPNALPIKAITVWVNDEIEAGESEGSAVIVDGALVVGWHLKSDGVVSAVFSTEHCSNTLGAYEVAAGRWSCYSHDTCRMSIAIEAVSYDELLSEIKAAARRAGLLKAVK
jgi:hypothetical protein